MPQFQWNAPKPGGWPKMAGAQQPALGRSGGASGYIYQPPSRGGLPPEFNLPPSDIRNPRNPNNLLTGGGRFPNTGRLGVGGTGGLLRNLGNQQTAGGRSQSALVGGMGGGMGTMPGGGIYAPGVGPTPGGGWGWGNDTGVGGPAGGWGGGGQVQGGAGGAGGASSPLTIGSQIKPQGIYSNRDTQAAMNQAIAQGQQTAYGKPQATMGGFAGNSPGLMSRNMATGAGALGNAMGQAEAIQLGDRQANLQNTLAGQMARGGDVTGQLRNVAGFDEANRGYGTQMGNQMIQAIQSLFGGIGRRGMEDIEEGSWWNRYGLEQQQAQMGQLQSLMGALNWS